MNITTSSTEISVRIFLFEDIDIDSFDEKFEDFISKNSDLLSLPIYIQFSNKIEIDVPSLSILVDSLKDRQVLISGLIVKDKSIRKFAAYLGIPAFKSLEKLKNFSIKNQQTLPTAPPPQQTSPQPTTPNVIVEKIDPYKNNGLTRPNVLPFIVKEDIPLGVNLKHDGDVIVLGEIKRGGIICATGSVHCYNKVNGTILAGSLGDKQARIYLKELNAEAMALAGYYAKNHQYSHVSSKAPLMVSLQNGNLNFNSIPKLPSIEITKANGSVAQQKNKEESEGSKAIPDNAYTKQEKNENPHQLDEISVDFSKFSDEMEIRHPKTTTKENDVISSTNSIIDNADKAVKIEKDYFSSPSVLSSLEEIDEVEHSETEDKTDKENKKDLSKYNHITPPLGT
jgi:septum site-determining protein MinC